MTVVSTYSGKIIGERTGFPTVFEREMCCGVSASARDALYIGGENLPVSAETWCLDRDIVLPLLFYRWNSASRPCLGRVSTETSSFYRWSSASQPRLGRVSVETPTPKHLSSSLGCVSAISRPRRRRRNLFRSCLDPFSAETSSFFCVFRKQLHKEKKLSKNFLN